MVVFKQNWENNDRNLQGNVEEENNSKSDSAIPLDGSLKTMNGLMN